jgi:hypothetical protein
VAMSMLGRFGIDGIKHRAIASAGAEDPPQRPHQAWLIPSALSSVASRRRAWNMRDFTVLSGIPKIAATSRTDLP